jgi:8-oxo-dGTP pyrophosphatase MutT (NUDIX family)
MKTEYVVGFLFDEYFENVVLINKKRPKWQNGKLNGVGGHVELNETAAEAMSREFKEETGLHVPMEEWDQFAEVYGSDYLVNFFFAKRDLYEFPLWKDSKNIPKRLFRILLMAASFGLIMFPVVKSTTDEEIEILRLEDLCGNERVIPNLKWLIPLALDPNNIYTKSEAK